MSKMDAVKNIILAILGIALIFIFAWGFMHLQEKQEKFAQGQMKNAKHERTEGEASGKKIDIDAVSKSFLEGIPFETPLTPIDAEVVQGMIELQEGSKCALYMGEGTFSDELLIVTSKSKSSAKKDQAAVESHLQEMKKSFEDYIPEQAVKVENAIVVRCGCYVVACVAKDSESAKKQIVDAFQ